MRKSKLVFQEDDALINGRDPDYRGIHEWWEIHFGRKFSDDWDAAEKTEINGGDCFTRRIVVNKTTYDVIYSFDGYSVYYADNPAVKKETSRRRKQ